MISTAVVGASGYAGGELLRLLAGHPHLELRHAMASSNAGKSITDLHPGLISYSGQSFTSLDPSQLSQCDLVFLALPHGESAAIAAQLPSTLRVVDLGADFRLQSAMEWKRYYSGAHAGTWTYGLTELAREEISESKKVANPGCYATAIALGIIPFADAIEGSISVVAASGTTGAGRSSAPHLTANEVMGSMSPYKIGGVHQHTPEIEQSIRLYAGVEKQINFTPILAPMTRGIIATINAVTGLDEKELRERFLARFADEKFVHLLAPGVMPSTSATFGSNSALIQIAKDERTSRATVIVTLDNLVKGAAGQAMQNANLMLGFDEGLGLSVEGVRP